MKFLKQMRNISIRKALLPAIFFVGFGVAIFLIFGCQHLFKTFAPKTLAELTPETLDGAYVEDDIYFIYAQYVEEEQYRDNRPTGKITGAQYLIDLDDVYYIGLFTHENDMAEASHLLDASYDYAMGNLPGEMVPVMHVKGTICAMDNEVSGYYHELADGDAELEALMLPYYLNVNRIGTQTPILVWIMLAVSVALWLIGIVPLIKAITGGYQKELKKKVASMGEESTMLEKLQLFYGNTSPVCGVRMGSDYVLFQSGPASILLRPWELAWAYQSTTQHRTNGIPSGKTYAAILRTMDGKQYTLSMNKKQVQELLDAIHATLPGTVLGYTKELESLYKNDRSAFAARWEEACPGCTAHS